MSVMQKNRRNTLLLGQDNNALVWLIIVNVVIFIIISFIRIVYSLAYDGLEADPNFHIQILDWFALNPSLGKLVYRPWTLLSSMFTHDVPWPWQLIGTLFWLWSFGYIMQDLTGNSKLIPVYIYGGFVGGILYVLTSNLIPQYNASIDHLAGGGAAVMAVALASTTLSPGYRIFPMLHGGIPLWVVTLIFVAIDYATIGRTNGSYAMAHLGGGIMGFVFAKQMQRGRDWGKWMNSLMSWLNDLFNPEKKFHKKPVRQQQFYKATKKPFEKTPRLTQQKLDEILDKINQDGYHSLTDEEKTFLKKASQEDF